ncbi:MAG: hypothetical protein AB1716_13415 [Planctomycetota bacterium]
MPLDQEIAFYRAHFGEWLRDHAGQYVLIKGSQFSFHGSDEEAYEAAVDKYGAADVLIKQVLPSDPVDGSLALLYGLLNGSAR